MGDIRLLKGVGEKTEALLRKLGINTTEELLNYYPRTYEVFSPVCEVSKLVAGETAAIFAKVTKNQGTKRLRNLNITTAFFTDNSGSIEITWFNMPFLQKILRPGYLTVLRGRVIRKNGRIVMEQPAMYQLDEYKKLVDVMQPIYALTAGLSNKTITKLIKGLLDEKAYFEDFIPDKIKNQYELAELAWAVKKIHFPNNFEEYKKARSRLVFDEFFTFIIMLSLRKMNLGTLPNPYKISNCREIKEFCDKLPYKLTNAQQRVLSEIQTDLTGDRLMSRLIQGDVGSGKTILAVLALMQVALSGYQGALMAPTEVLAKQHYESVTNMFAQYGVRLKVALLTGSMTAKEKRETYDRIKRHEVDIIVGTHALIQDKVEYDRLALVVTDEQHRFGVRQRETFMKKGSSDSISECNAHVLVMSATPIPRTLAIILYGDLDISLVDELPADRLPIKNCVVDTSYRPNAYRFIENEIHKGHQAYIICPMVEENEEFEAESVINYTNLLKNELSDDIQTEYLHGRMKAADKNAIMERFAKNEINVLVSTTVIEVGINVPNSTVMLVENAERFGLAQLHQLRGRVGRGNAQSYCIFINSSEKDEAKERLNILAKSNDGFYIAQEDLKLRGPGDLLGIRQSGDMVFKIGDIYQDADILKAASDSAKLLLEENPNLTGKEYERLFAYVANLEKRHSDTLNL